MLTCSYETLTGLEQVDVVSCPTGKNWRFPTLYKIDVRGKERMWFVAFVHKKQSLYKVSGLSSGEKVIGESFVTAKGNNTLQEQALQEARRIFSKKKREGYFETQNITPEDTFYSPSESQDYKEEREMSDTIIIQPKLDGIRISSYLRGENVITRTRGGIFYTHLGFLHEYLLFLFGLLPSGSMLDGELYRHGYSLQSISSILKTGINQRGGITGDHHPHLNRLQYWIFDINTPVPTPMEERIGILKNLEKVMEEQFPNQNRILFVKSHKVHFPCEDAEDKRNRHREIVKWQERYLKLGYEGIMVKQTSDGETSGKKWTRSIYKNGRTVNTLKFKPIDKDEGTIIEIIPSQQKPEFGVLKMRDNKRGTEFYLWSSTEDQKRDWLLNPDEYIGKTITYFHFGFTDNKLPRHPVTNPKRK